eukprot:12921766-Prorocentrum_lima.AAC.1
MSSFSKVFVKSCASKLSLATEVVNQGRMTQKSVLSLSFAYRHRRMRLLPRVMWGFATKAAWETYRD